MFCNSLLLSTMKKFFFLVMMVSEVAAQNRTNVWELSYTFGTAPKCELRYNGSSMDTNSVYRVMSFFDTNASICDTNGNLLFYSNGITIGNRNYDTLQNAVDFNPGWATDFNDPQGMSTCQGVLILPDPGNPDQYYIFHESGEEFIAYGDYQVQPLHLSYSVVNMNLDGGLGGIVDTLKNKYAIIDTLLWGGLTAVKHANGRDWWIIIHRFYNDKCYKLLLTPQGVEGPYEQTIGSYLGSYDAVVQATFSPDGSKYCISNNGGLFDYFDFDRCTGEFSNYKTGNDSAGFFGCSFSPNSRFLYMSSLVDLYQYDTWDSNMIADVVHIATWDSFYHYGNPIWFFMHQLAPDGRIYLSVFSGEQYLNVINSPDSLGIDCNFTPHSFLLTHYGFSDNIPSFPNYDLGSLQGSPCDTLYNSTSNLKPQILNFSLSPNPSSTYINIVYSIEQNAELTFTDAYGRVVKQLTLYPYFKNRIIYTDGLSVGVYLVTMREGEKISSKKLIITR